MIVDERSSLNFAVLDETSARNPMRLDALIRDFVAWVAKEPRPYAEALEAWRTSCPRLTVWEDAFDRGLVQSERKPGGGIFVVATAVGRRFLAQDRDRT